MKKHKLRLLTVGILTALCALALCACVPTDAPKPQEPSKLDKPTITVNSAVYNGEAQTFVIDGWNAIEKYVAVTGSLTQTDVGNYSVTVSFKDDAAATWKDGTTAAVTLDYAITPLKLDKPTITVNSAVYNGEAQTFEIEGWDALKSYAEITGSLTQTDVGNYSVTVSLKSTANTTWKDDTTADVTLDFEIVAPQPAELDKPTITVNSAVYNGEAQTFEIAGWDALKPYAEVTGSLTQTDVGDYSVTVSFKDGTAATWKDGTTAAVTLDYAITPLKLDKPTMTENSKVYNGEAQTFAIDGLSAIEKFVTVTGSLAQTDVGDYSVTVSLKSTANTTWNDDTTADVTLGYTVTPVFEFAPTQAALYHCSVHDDGYIGGFEAHQNSIVQYKLNSAAAEQNVKFEFTVACTCQNSDKQNHDVSQMNLLAVNGESAALTGTVINREGEGGGSWENWCTVTATVNLKHGENVITLYNFDYAHTKTEFRLNVKGLRVFAQNTAASVTAAGSEMKSTRYEAENAAFTGQMENPNDEHDNTFVQIASDTDTVTWTVNSTEARKAIVILHAATRDTGVIDIDERDALTVNGDNAKFSGQLIPLVWLSFTDVAAVAELDAGDNTIVLSGACGIRLQVDYIDVILL